MEASGIVMEPGTTYPETCSQCGGSDLRRETVRSAFWHDERLVVVENIPALVCGSCGERYYDDPTIARPVPLFMLSTPGRPKRRKRPAP